jgi:hypothetical protein
MKSEKVGVMSTTSSADTVVKGCAGNHEEVVALSNPLRVWSSRSRRACPPPRNPTQTTCQLRPAPFSPKTSVPLSVELDTCSAVNSLSCTGLFTARVECLHVPHAELRRSRRRVCFFSGCPSSIANQRSRNDREHQQIRGRSPTRSRTRKKRNTNRCIHRVLAPARLLTRGRPFWRSRIPPSRSIRSVNFRMHPSRHTHRQHRDRR